MQDQPVAPGQILAGKYRIERVLGAGGMGMVLAATHVVLGSRVAIKVMLGGGKKGPEQEERFLREARVAVMLRSQHAGKVLDVGTLEGGAPYIVMEFLDGKDLSTILLERGPLPAAEAVGLVLQACEALAEAHGLGIVHRDIKPANLFLTSGVDGAPIIKVVDFGIAKDLTSGLALTGTIQALGSPLYMSPEAMRGSRDVDARSDLWALGVTLYQLLAGTTPFQADSLPVLVTQVCQYPATPLTEHRSDLPPGLVAVIMACFEKDRDRRWPSMAALASALAPYAPQGPGSYAARVAHVQRVEVAPSRPTDLLPPEPVARALPPAVLPSVSTVTPRGPSRGVALAVLPLAAALGLAVFFSLRARGGGSDAPASSSARADVSATAIPTAGEAVPTATAAIAPPPTATSASAAASVTSVATAAAPHRPPPPVRAPLPAQTAAPWGGSRR